MELKHNQFNLELKYKIVLLLLPIVISCVLLLIVSKPDINLLDSKQFRIFKFSDVKDGGNSICNLQVSNNLVDVDYHLKPGYAFPYAGVIWERQDKDLFDIENYILQLQISTKQDLNISIRLNQFLENYSDTSKPMSLVLMLKSIALKKGNNSLEIHTKDINEIPEWWYKNNPTKLKGFADLELTKTRNIWFFNDSFVPVDKPIAFEVAEMKLKYNYLPWIKLVMIFSFIYYACFIGIFIFYKTKFRYVFMPIEATKFVDQNKILLSKIEAFIIANYSNPDLLLKDLANNIAQSEDKTSEVLKQFYNIGFRQYLNQMRMEEAKRLLKESNLQIAEIAFKVGYNNIQHFNRVFKEYTDDSPKSFREKS